jgi:hypothetical protein
MKRFLRLLNRFGIGRAICLVLLFDLVVLRVWVGLARRAAAQELSTSRGSRCCGRLVVDIDEESPKGVGQWAVGLALAHLKRGNRGAVLGASSI